MNKIAICYICTGKYSVFWDDFFTSFEKRFCVHSEKHYYVFTDAKELAYSSLKNVHVIYQKNLGWPDNTLRRYEMFLKIKEALLKHEYIFFFNANSYCAETITEEEFLPVEEQFLVVQHPFYYKKSSNDFPYDRNIDSTAYIPFGEGTYYICGGINGGKAEAFMSLSETINSNIQLDDKKKITALWHDESHINKYIIGRHDYKLLSPAYCYPEEVKGELPFECKILIRYKLKYFDANKERRLPMRIRIFHKIKSFIQKMIHIK